MDMDELDIEEVEGDAEQHIFDITLPDLKDLNGYDLSYYNKYMKNKGAIGPLEDEYYFPHPAFRCIERQNFAGLALLVKDYQEKYTSQGQNQLEHFQEHQFARELLRYQDYFNLREKVELIFSELTDLTTIFQQEVFTDAKKLEMSPTKEKGPGQ